MAEMNTKTRRSLLALLTACFMVVPAHAVLTEKNLDQTLEVLNVELSNTYAQLKSDIAFISKHTEQQHKKMVSIMQLSNQISLMLYSQQHNYTFNLAYACHEAAQQYQDFTAEVMPYDKIMEQLDSEIDRYTKLTRALQEIPPRIETIDSTRADSLRPRANARHKALPFLLDAKGQANREACLGYTASILNEYTQLRNALSKDSEHYERIGKRLKSVFDYAQLRYRSIQKSIFINGDDSYFKLLSNLPTSLTRAKRDWHNKYSNDIYARHHVSSEWRGPVVLGLIMFVTFYFLLAFLLSNVVVRLLMRKVKRFQEETIRLKTDCIITAASLVFFAVAVMLVRAFLKHSFIIMASQLLVSFAWLTAVILISLMIRLNGKQINAALRLYMPIIVLGFIVIVMRIIFVPNSIVSLVFPPILLLFTIWQAVSLRKAVAEVTQGDRIYSWITLILMISSCVMAWAGYVLMAVQAFIWWLIQLTLTQTITCIYDWLCTHKERRLAGKMGKKAPKMEQSILKRDGTNIQYTWAYDFIGMVLVPLAAIGSVLFSIYYAAQVFDLTEICMNAFYTPFINLSGICRLSAFMLVVVVGLFFVFNYASYAIKAAYRHLRLRQLAKKNKGVGVVANQANISLFNNLMAILIWGGYALLVLSILRVPKSGLSLVSAGLATGVGFAMKSLIENFFYGISLMTGRLRMGDWIECDGIRGKVESIAYQSTQIVTEDGQVITFMNSTLFNQSFKNLTHNHLYEKSKIPIGVAYGTNVAEVRTVLSEAIKGIMRKGKNGRPIVQPERGVSVLVSGFGDSSIDLLVIFWTLVEEKTLFDCQAREAVYDALNKHQIEIPFPQRDIHIRPIPEKE